MKSLAYASALAVTVSMAVPASAATVIYTGSIKADGGVNSGGDVDGKSTISYAVEPRGTTFVLAGGDTHKGTIQVADGKSITVFNTGPNRPSGLETIVFSAQNYSNYAVRFTSKVSLGGITGDYIGAPEYAYNYAGYAFDFNTQIFPTINANLTNTSFAFTSLSFEVTLAAGDPATFYFPNVRIEGQPTPPPPPVPEPATWALMMMGFGGMGYALRRRRSGAALI